MTQQILYFLHYSLTIIMYSFILKFINTKRVKICMHTYCTYILWAMCRRHGQLIFRGNAILMSFNNKKVKCITKFLRWDECTAVIKKFMKLKTNYVFFSTLILAQTMISRLHLAIVSLNTLNKFITKLPLALIINLKFMQAPISSFLS